MITIIDDSDFKRFFPTPMATDTQRLNAVILLTQATNVRDLLGDSLYQYVIKFIEDGEPEKSNVNLIIDELKMLHCMYAAIAFFSVYKSEDDESKRDFSISYIRGNANALERNIINLVQSDEGLLNIALLSTDNAFERDKSNFNTIYFDE